MSDGGRYGPELSYTAGADLDPYRLVKQDSSGNAVYCTATDVPIGVTVARALSGKQVRVRMWNAPGLLQLTASKSIAINTLFYAGASGKVTDSSSGGATKLGYSASAAGADGDVFQAQLMLGL